MRENERKGRKRVRCLASDVALYVRLLMIPANSLTSIHPIFQIYLLHSYNTLQDSSGNLSIFSTPFANRASFSRHKNPISWVPRNASSTALGWTPKIQCIFPSGDQRRIYILSPERLDTARVHNFFLDETAKPRDNPTSINNSTVPGWKEEQLKYSKESLQKSCCLVSHPVHVAICCIQS
jgi:hypothetical protein